MAGVVNFLKTVKNNWKKSLIGSAALAYGVNYGIDSYETQQMMREFCEEAVKYGDMPIPPKVQPTHMIVILNPVAKKRKAKKLFEKYCEPLLHLAGIAITIIQTESESHARTLVENLNTRTDAIIVAGGDGTLSDVVTGLMRKCQSKVAYVKQCPIGVLPLGQTNRVADSLLGKKEVTQAQVLAEATMSIVRGNTKLVDIVEVIPLENNPENPVKPAYAVGAIEWGAWKDAHSRVDKYWYWGPFRKYVTYIFNGNKDDLNWNCSGMIRYSDPCDGCSRCYHEQNSVVETSSGKRWWHAFVSRRNTVPTEFSNRDYSNVTNENCGIFKEIPISATELFISTKNIQHKNQELESGVKVEIGPSTINYKDFVSEGWRRVSGDKKLVKQILKAKDIELHPEKDDSFKDKNRMFYIDNEEFELKPVKIKLLPQSVKMFCPSLQNER